MTQGKVKIQHPVHGSRYVSQRSWQLMTECDPGGWSLARAAVLEVVRETIVTPIPTTLTGPKKGRKSKGV